MIKPTNKLFGGIVVTFAILNQMQGSIFIGLDLSQPDHKQYKEIQVLKQDESKSKVFSALGVITADEKSSPTLFKMVDNLAQKLSLPIPKILIFKGNSLWNVLEHCGIDFKCNAFAYSLSRSFGFICNGLFKIEKISKLKQRIINDFISEIKSMHPLSKNRAQYIKKALKTDEPQVA